MAGELVGGAFLSAFLQVLFDRMNSRELLDFFHGRKLNDQLLKKLHTVLNCVNGLLDDAEEKQITKEAVKKWVDDIKNFVFEADDLLDEIAYEALRSKLDSRRQKVRTFTLFGNQFNKRVEQKLEEILEKLEFVVKQKDTLGLIEGIGKNPLSQKIPSTCLVIESDVYGRSDDKKAIIELLLSHSKDLDVISIVGMGGIGKTTLAQLVYNASSVQEHFEVKAWVCVSEEFDVFKLTKAILEEVIGQDLDTRTLTSLNQVQLQLKNKLEKKKFLIVLDDVWNDKQDEWEVLETALRFGAEGSKIVVTTRNEQVALAMNTVTIYRLKELNDDECWSLFKRRAFRDENSSSYPALEQIGREIVKKCKGLPLAAKTLGGLLHTKTDVNEWEMVLTSNLWNLSNDNIFPALRLSYYYLPSYLKRCFAYCGMFPKDYEFQKEELVLLWMAEGFLVQPKVNKEAEDIGNEYFSDLVSRSLFQQSSHSQSSFVMHDLIHDLAKFVFGEFCFRLEDDDSCKIPKTIRYLSHVSGKYKDLKNFEDIYKSQPVRTLFLNSRWSSAYMEYEEMYDLLSSLKHMRVLYLSSCYRVTKLPKSIGNLKHLRYLNLSGSSITRLPESMGGLYNLQTLILYECKSLVELPSNMESLLNLCYLDIRCSKVQEMPQNMCNLTRLHKLTDFIIGKHSASNIRELGKLQHLREVGVQNLQNVVSVQDASEANLKEKKHLKKLELKWGYEIEKNAEPAGCVLGQLQPHVNMEHLFIYGYRGTFFPDWVGDSSLVNLVSLKLSECNNCSSLPPLGQLPSLKDLSITGFSGVSSVDHEFYGSCIRKPFGSLEILRFERMRQWREWNDEAGAFPLLQALYIRSCPELIKGLPTHLPSLTKLVIQGCQKLAYSLPRALTIYEMDLKTDWTSYAILDELSFGMYSLSVCSFYSVNSLLGGVEQMNPASLEYIKIRSCHSLECFPIELFPNLKRLEISACSNLESFFKPEATSGGHLSSSSLEIQEHPNSMSFPTERSSNFPLLEKLCISYCPQLCVLSLPRAPTIHSFSLMDNYRNVALEKLPSGLYRLRVDKLYTLEEIKVVLNVADFTTLEEIIITNCDSLKCFPLKLFSKLKGLVINRCLNFESLYEYAVTNEEFTSLNSLEIRDCPNLGSFPKGGLPTPNLARLLLWGCSNLKSLPEYMHSLHSLVDLRIHYCPELDLFPEGGFPPKLESFEIQSCNKVSSLTCITLSNYEETAESFPKESLLLPSSLTHLRISNLYHLKSIKHKGLKHLRELSIQNCPNLQFMPEFTQSLLPSLVHLKIDNCPEIEPFPNGGLPLKLESLVICNCNKLVVGLLQCDLHLLPSLAHFTISGNDDEDLFPELPSSLTSLHILHLKNLRSLQLQHFTSLRELEIGGCLKLESLPGERLPSSLNFLNIYDCPLLNQIFFKEDGKSWPKISHIPNIIINDFSSFTHLI